MSDPDWQVDISEWRERIDDLDLQLLRTLNERARCAIEIGRIKRRQRIPIYDPKREEQIIRIALAHNEGPLDPDGIRRLFERIIDESRRIERVTAESPVRPEQRQAPEEPDGG